jgi:hypothetical protein
MLRMLTQVLLIPAFVLWYWAIVDAKLGASGDIIPFMRS